MNHKKIKSILQDALEEEIPSSHIQLWPTVKANLVLGKHNLPKQGETMNTTNIKRVPRFALGLLVILALLVVVLITPQGRSFAQGIWQYFVPADGTTFELQPSQINLTEPDPSAPTAEPPAPLIGLAEAEASTGFDALELPAVPPGLNYLGARLYGDAISIEYEAQGSGGNLIILQSQDGFYQSDWDRVPADAIVPVKVGDLDGEFVQGTFVVFPGDTSATWNPEAAMLRLRWRENDTWIEMAKYGDVESIEYLDLVEMIKLAESMVH